FIGRINASVIDDTSKVFGDPLLLQKDAASLLGVSVSTLARWRKLKTGPEAFKLGGRNRYRLSELQAFIARSEDEAL
ncbi:helix-turn-helix domain-containing protein, partial [Salmonella enterica]|nr:helix-turn-helix domain-containing protein [Salmonella enterica]